MNQSAEMTTILIADDDPSHLMLAEAALAGAGFLVHTAADGGKPCSSSPRYSPTASYST